MKTRIALISMLLLAPIALATEPPPAPPALPPILALAPADALVVAYFARPDDVFKHPVWSLPLGNKSELGKALATAAAFDGPFMIAVSGSPTNPASLRLEFAAQPQGGAESFFANLNRPRQPAAAEPDSPPDATPSPTPAPAAKANLISAVRPIRLSGLIPVPILAAARDGMVYGSSRSTDAMAWLEGKEMPPRFAAAEDARKVLSDATMSADAFIYINTRALMPVPVAEIERVVPGLSAALGIDRLQCAALTAGWSRNLDVRLVLGLADGEGGVVDLVAPQNRPSDIGSLLATDYPFIIRGTLTNAADSVDVVNSILAAVDPDIVSEFRDECADFRADFGFDPLEDFLGNLVDEWAVGLRFDDSFELNALAAVRLADPSRLQSQIDALIRDFNLDIDYTVVSGTMIYTAPAASGKTLAWAIVGDQLLIGKDFETIATVARRANDADPVQPSRSLQALMRYLPHDSAGLVLIDAAEGARLALRAGEGDPELAEFEEAFKKLADSPAAIGVAFVRGEGALSVRLAATPAIDKDARALFWKSIDASMTRARMLSKRLVSMSNIQGILTACFLYANDHKEAWPQSFAELLELGLVGPPSFRSPLDDSQETITVENVDRLSSYLYRDGTGLPPTEVVICDRELHDGGAGFGFADGHVEWIEGARAKELLAGMQAATR